MNRLPALDLLRGVAALGVMFFHLSLAVQAHIDPSFPTVPTGHVGVWLFFTISGYVILASAMRER